MSRGRTGLGKNSALALSLLAALAVLLQATANGAQTWSLSRGTAKETAAAVAASSPSSPSSLSSAADAPAPSQSPTPIVVPRLPPATPTPTPSAPRGATTDDDAPARPVVSRTPTPANAAVPQPTPADVLEDEDDVVRVESNLVVVPTSVTDAAGEPVQGLRAEDFRLEEEGRRQEIAQVGVAEQVPLDIALLFDVSSSVTKNFEFEKSAAAGFLREVMKPNDRAAVFTIAETPRMAAALAPAGSAASTVATLAAADKATGTAFYDTVSAAARYLAENTGGRHRRVILVISDAEDNFSSAIKESSIDEYRAIEGAKTDAEKNSVRASRRGRQDALHRKALQAVLRDVQHADAVFYSINPSGEALRLNVISTRAQEGMRQLAEATGGSAFVPEKIDKLDPVFRRIAAELRAQYLLQYYSSSDAPAGKYLKISVRTPPRPDLRVRARQGYYVPKQK